MAQLVTPKRLNPLDDVAQYLGIKSQTQGLQLQKQAIAENQRQSQADELDQQQKIQLQAIFKDPASWDQKTGAPTREALIKAGAIHPKTAAELAAAYKIDPTSLATQANDQSQIDYRGQQSENLKADNTRADIAAADRQFYDKTEAGRKSALESAGVMIPGTEFTQADTAGKPQRAAQYRILQPDGSYKTETRVIGSEYQKPATDTTTTPFEAWQKQNPTGKIEDWLKLGEKATAASKQGTRVVQTLDTQGRPVTRIVPDIAGTEFPDQPTSIQQNRDTALKNIGPILDSVSELSEKINTGKGLEAKAAGEAAKIAARANYNDDVAEYQAIISGFTPMIARAVGHTGVLTQQDVDSVKELFPKPGDSKTLRDRKIARVKSILEGAGGGGPTPPPSNKPKTMILNGKTLTLGADGNYH